jgi:hypothetical protein
VSDTGIDEAELADITARFEVAMETASSAAAAAHAGHDPDNLIARGLVEAAARVVARLTSPAIAEKLFDAAASDLWDDANPAGNITDNDQAPRLSAAEAEKKRRMRQLQKASRKANRRK